MNQTNDMHHDFSHVTAGVVGFAAVSVPDEVANFAVKLALGVLTGVLSGLAMKMFQKISEKK